MNSRIKIMLLATALLFTLQSYGQTRKNKNSDTVSLSGHMNGLKSTDTLLLYVWDGLIGKNFNYSTSYREFKSGHTNGNFSFKIDGINDYTYFSFGLNSRRFQGKIAEIIRNYIMEAGDEVRIIVKDSGIVNKFAPGDGSYDSNAFALTFFGKGSKKYNLYFKIDSLTTWKNIQNRVHNKQYFSLNAQGKLNEALVYYLNTIDSARSEAEQLLKFNQNKLSSQLYDILRAELIGNTEWSKLNQYLMSTTSYGWKHDSVFKEQLRTIYRDRLENIEKEQISNDALIKSPSYLEYVTYKAYNDVRNIEDKGVYRKMYLKIKGDYAAKVRDYLIVNNFFNHSFAMEYYLSEKGKELLEDMISTVQDFNCKKLLIETRNNNRINIPAYNFSLPDVNGNYINLNSLKGKVVFIDLWYSGCGGCTQYYKGVLKGVEEKYKDHPDVKFITISIDGTKELWLKGLKGGAYTGEHAINLYTDGQGSRHPFIENYNVTGYPSPFLIDKNGILIARGMEKLGGSPANLIASIEDALKK